MKTRLSESEAEAEKLNQSQSVGMFIVIGLVPPLLYTSDSDNLVFTRSYAERMRRSRKRSRKKWKRSDSSDSHSVALLTPLTTPIFDFH